MPLAPSLAANQGIVHSSDPVTILDYPYAVSIMEMSGATTQAISGLAGTTYNVVGTNSLDDSAAINALALVLKGTGISMFFPANTYKVSTNAINLQGVNIILGNGAAFTGTYASSMVNGTAAGYARGVFTTITTSTTYTGSGTGTLTFGSNAATGTQDGITVAVGDVFILQGGTLGSCAITAKDTGPWVFTSLGTASAPVILSRPSWWANGITCPTGYIIKVGPEGTLFGSTQWRSFANPGTVVGTTDSQFYPDQVSQSVVLVAGTVTVTNVPLKSATKSQTWCSVNTLNTATSTVGYGVVAAPTAGYQGACSIVVDAYIANMTKNASDVSTVILTVQNW
jgi:hypothetical protein